LFNLDCESPSKNISIKRLTIKPRNSSQVSLKNFESSIPEQTNQNMNLGRNHSLKLLDMEIEKRGTKVLDSFNFDYMKTSKIFKESVDINENKLHLKRLKEDFFHFYNDCISENVSIND
jgi:hypothetical protein